MSENFNEDDIKIQKSISLKINSKKVNLPALKDGQKNSWTKLYVRLAKGVA